MQIQVNTDNHIQGSEELSQYVKSLVEDELERFSTRITRVEVHLSDENSSVKSGEKDKRCVLEARVRGLQPLTVSHQAESLDLAISGAADKLDSSLSRTLGKLDDPRRGPAMPDSEEQTDEQ